MQNSTQWNHNGHNGHNANGYRRQGPIIPWPAPISDIGMWGITGDFVRLVEPHTEADRNSIAFAHVTLSGNHMGRSYYMSAGADWHFPNMYTGIVGTTATGRKGSAISAALAFFTRGPYPPLLPHVVFGISSGEGLMNLVRDPKIKEEYDKKTKTTEIKTIDPGVTDKRVVIVLPEFQQCLAVMRRNESTTSSVLRQAWDTGRIASPTKQNDIIVNDAHISMIGCISKDELLREILAVDANNGTLNRFMFVCSQRSRLLPEGGNFDRLIKSKEWADLQQRFIYNCDKARPEKEPIPYCIERDSDCQDEWGRDALPYRGLYSKYSQPDTGMKGAVTARGAQHVMRMAETIAVINGLSRIHGEAQAAAGELWRYARDSALYIFGNYTLDPFMEDSLSVELIQALRENRETGLSRLQIHDLFHKKAKSADIQTRLASLAEHGIVYCFTNPTSGRPVETWFAQL